MRQALKGFLNFSINPQKRIMFLIEQVFTPALIAVPDQPH
jgi:hypothetical protein